MSDRAYPLGAFARAGFQDLSRARSGITDLAARLDCGVELLLTAFSAAADPDAALQQLTSLVATHQQRVAAWDEAAWRRATRLFGASSALATFFARHPERLFELVSQGGSVPTADVARRRLLASVEAGVEAVGTPPIAALHGEAGWQALRVTYRELLAQLALVDLEWGDTASFDVVSQGLSDLAAAALEAALAVARGTLLHNSMSAPVTAEAIAATRLAVIAMGKCGAAELNVVSDVDVMFVCEPSGELSQDEALRIATRLATELMRAIHDPGIEPPLWQVDANLRPEGRHGPLVRTLSSMLAYYDRWAQTWEFQALLKARSVAGDLALGEAFVAGTRQLVWSSSGREDFVASVQRMRERVTEHISDDDREVEIKLGPGGLRDIEFSVQLLQLVHGQYDERLRVAGTLPALSALVEGGYVARSDGEQLAADYRWLRTVEHRLQLRELRRTATMPLDAEATRVLARATGLAATGDALLEAWRAVKLRVRELHLKIFYAPLLGAVAALPDDEMALSGDAARARLQSIGFRDPDGALRHLAALTRGTSRNARIQRNLLPVLLQWLAEGTDPDHGLLAFRRVSEANRDTPWYLRLLRDGSEAAERLTRVLASSRFAGDLLEAVPEAVAWLERDDLLRPVPLAVLLEEMRALASRRGSIDDAAEALRTVHRREVLRLALGLLVGVNDDADVAAGLDAAHTALLDGLLLAIRTTASDTSPALGAVQAAEPAIELALIGMGRYGGRELGFASDIDLLAVYRVAPDADPAHAKAASKTAERLVSELRRLVSDPRFAVDLDFDLRPEGKNGPIVRTLEAYRSYYERWSLTWEAQALLRARPVAGDVALGADFMALADSVRYPQSFGSGEVREVRRIKARVEAERLPQGADPSRHLKLGPGGISDVEWLVQLLQLQYGVQDPALRTSSTLAALEGAVAAGLLSAEERSHLEAAWRLASRIRSAIKLWSGRASDVLPSLRDDLEGIAGVLGYSPGHTTELEERWFATARRSRAVFERAFFGYSDHPETFPLILP